MRSRILKIVIGVLVLALILWFGSHLKFEETKLPLPLKGEAARNPFYAAIRFSEALGAEAAWERVFTAPPQDSVIFLSNWNWTLSRTRRARIEHWVEGGGRLVVDGSLIGGFDEFKNWTGISDIIIKDKDDEDETDSTSDADAAEDTDTEDVDESTDASGDDRHKKLQRNRNRRRPVDDEEQALADQFMPEDCSTLTEDVSKREYKVCGVDDSRSLASARKMSWALREGTAIQALRVALGRGSVTVLNASPFRFRTFFKGDHPSLFVTITQLHRGDAVLFLTEEKHASILTLVWRFGAPVVLLLLAGIALGLWRVSARFGPQVAPTEPARRSLAEQIRGTGQFALRFGGGKSLHAAAVRALRDAAIRRLPTFDRMASEERVAALVKLTGVVSSELGPALNYSGARSPHELRNVIAVLEAARRRLLSKRQRNGN